MQKQATVSLTLLLQFQLSCFVPGVAVAHLMFQKFFPAWLLIAFQESHVSVLRSVLPLCSPPRKVALFVWAAWTAVAVEMVSATIYQRGVEPAPEQLSRWWMGYLAERAEDEEGEGKHLDLHFRPICGQPRGNQPVWGWEGFMDSTVGRDGWMDATCGAWSLMLHIWCCRSSGRSKTHTVMKTVGRSQKKHSLTRTQTDIFLQQAWNVSSNIGRVPSSEHLSPLWITLFTLLIFKRPWSAVPR